METVTLRLDQIEPDPNQPRKTKSEEYLRGLGNSIKNEGLQSPITVRKHPEKAEMFMIVFGECRWTSCGMVGLETIECFVKEYADDKSVYLAQIVENTVREDLPPMEQADSFRDALLRGVEIEDLAEKTGLSVSTIAADVEMAQIKDSMVRKLIDNGEIPKAVGRALASFSDSKIRTATEWALGLRNAKGTKKPSGKRTVRQMMAGLDAYRQADGQLHLGYDYSQDAKEIKKELVKAGKAYDNWCDKTTGFMKKYGNGKLGDVLKAREGSIDKVKVFAKELEKLAVHFQEEAEKLEAVAS